MKHLLATVGILLATSAQAVSLQNLSEQELTHLFSELDQNSELSLLDNTSGRQVKVLRVLPKTAEDRTVLPVSASCITFYGCDDKVCLLDHNGQKFLGALSELQTTMRRSIQGNNWQECRYQAPYAALAPKASQAPTSPSTDAVTSQSETSLAQARPSEAKAASTAPQISQQPEVITSQAEVVVQPEQSVEQIEQPIALAVEPEVLEQTPPATSDYGSEQYLQVVNVSLNDVLNIRQAPNARAAKVAQMSASTSCIKNLGCEGQWCQIEFLGLTGWSHNNYLTPLTGDALAACQQRGY